MSRSGTVVIGYLMKKFGLSFEEALLRVRKIKPVCRPNPAFAKQLKAWSANFGTEK
jgi:protein-tyrosine phosphatase